MKTSLLLEIRQRRLLLGLKIQDMTLRAGLTRQQYAKIERDGNPRLNTLDQIAEGLDAAIVLVPKDQLAAVRQLLAGHNPSSPSFEEDEPDDPWEDLL